jgi:hypothetical protein
MGDGVDRDGVGGDGDELLKKESLKEREGCGRTGDGGAGSDRSGDLSGDRPQRQTFSLGGYTALGQCAQFQQTGLETWHVPRSLDTGTDGVYTLNIASCLLRLEMLENTGP